MKCPYCGAEESKVIDSRPTEDSERIRRRRECLNCHMRFTTYEVVETVPLIVIKKDNSREPFDRQKLLNAMLRACAKRPVSYEALEKRWKDGNAERSEKVKKGEVIYGLKEYTFQLYLDYELSTLKEKYCNDTSREGMKLTEDEVLQHYQSRDWIFGGSEENADLETARIAVERELREQKYDDMITQRENGSQVEGNMKDVNRFTLKNIQ